MDIREAIFTSSAWNLFMWYQKGRNGEGSAVEAAANRARMRIAGKTLKASVNGEPSAVRVVNGLRRNKRKPKFVKHIAQPGKEAGGCETGNLVQVAAIDKSDEKPVDLSIRNSQDEALERNNNLIADERGGEENSHGGNDGMDYCDREVSTSAEANSAESSPISQQYGGRTLSTFLPAEQEELRRKASRIQEGAVFECYNDFEDHFKAFMIVGSSPLRVSSSERLKDSDEHVNERFKYKYRVFQCAHFGVARKRGEGKRPNQNYLPSGCEAKFRLNADLSKQCLRITSFNGTHTNHENSEEDYLLVVNKKRKNISGGPAKKVMKRGSGIKKSKGSTEETEMTVPEHKQTAVIKPDVDEHTKAPNSVENRSATFLSPENPPRPNSLQGSMGCSGFLSPGNFTSIVSSSANSAFMPIIRPAGVMDNEELKQISLQSSPVTDSDLKELITAEVYKRLQRMEYLIMNAYIISCGSCLPDTVYLPFISGVYGGEFRLSEWSSKQLRDVTTILLQPPEALLDGKLPADISINEVKQFWPARIQRAISAIRVEKLMRCEKLLNSIFTNVFQNVFNIISRHDFLVALGEFKNFAGDLRSMIAKKTA